MDGQPLELIAVEIRGDVDRLEGDMAGAVRIVDASTQKISRSVQQSEQAIVRSTSNSSDAMAKTGNTSRLLGQQFSQMGQQVAAGASPFQAFAIQLPDLAVAMSMTGAEAGSLAAFFGGPWGIALSTAAAVALSLAGDILKIGDAATEAEAALDSLIKKRSQAISKDSEIPLGDAGLAKLYEQQQKLQDFINRQPRNSANGQPLFAYKQQEELRAVNLKILSAEDALRSARYDAAQEDRRNTEAAIADRAKLAGATTALDRAQAQYNISIRDAQTAYEKSNKGAEAQQQLLEKRTAAERALNQAQDANRKKRPNNAAQRLADRTDAEIARLQEREIRARIDLTTDASERADLQKELLNRERDEVIRRAKAAKTLNPQMQQLIDTLYGKPGFTDQQGNIVSEGRPGLLDQAVDRKEQERIAKDALAVQLAGLDIDRDLLQTNADLADSRAERRDIEKSLLDIAIRRERAELDAVVASETATAAEKQIAQERLKYLGAIQTAGNQAIDRKYEGPLGQYRRDIDNPDRAGDMVESAVVSELQSVRDGITNAVQKTLGIKNPILAALINSFIEQQLIRPFLEGFGGSGGNVVGSVISGVGHLFGFASGGSGVFGGRGGTDRNVLSLNGKPFANVSRGEPFNIGNKAARWGGASGMQQTILVDARGAVMNDQFAREILAQANSYSAQASQAAYSKAVVDAPAIQAKRQRYG